MKLSSEEKLMYQVMKAIYDSGIPMSFKGSMVLKACLMEAGFTEEIRHTVDIDANWNTADSPTADHMVDSLQQAIGKTGISLNVRLYRMYGIGRSAGFELIEPSTGEILFTMDVDVNRPVMQVQMYEIDGVRFPGASPVQMIADKVSAISTDKVFRRIKDVVDLYYVSTVFAFNRNAILQALENSGKTLGSFDGFLHKTEELQHAYEKFRFAGDVDKIPFHEIYQAVASFIGGILPAE